MPDIRAPLSEVLTTNITNPSPTTVFVVSDTGVEGNLSVAAAISLLEVKGDKGDPGTPGYGGSTGYTGSTGTQGVQGITGFTGSTGTQGVRGFVGSKGDQGIPGYWGSTGYTGSTGTQGRAGFVGSRGFVGSTGTVGFTGSAGLTNTTATSVWGGVGGSILIQQSYTTTAFISPGNDKTLLQYNTATTTATWVSTSSLWVNGATNSDKEYVSLLTSSEITPTRYLTMVAGVNSYYGAGANADLTYHTNNKRLSSPLITVTSTTNALSTTTGALIVTGGIGVGGDLFIGGTITANKLVIQYTTVTSVSVTTDDVTTINNATQSTAVTNGALVVAGGVGIGKDLRVSGVIYGTVSGSILNASNLANGTVGQVPYQSAPSTTLFANAGLSGQIFVSNGASVIGPAFKSTSTILVGYASNLLGGGVGYLPYQSGNNTTAFLAPGTIGTVLTSDGSGGLSWTTVSSGGGGSSASSTTSTNLAAGTVGQVPFQTAPGRTSFYGPGTAGQLLVSAGAVNTGPVYTSTSTIKVGYAGVADNIGGGGAGYIPIQSANGQTAFIPTGSEGYVLQMTGNTATWVALSGVASGLATTATNLAFGSGGRIPYQIAAGVTGFTNSGTAGTVLVSRGLGSPVFQNTLSLTSLTLTGSIAATNTFSGTLIVNGGVSISGALFVGGQIYGLNEITAYYGTPSDVRLKTNIEKIDDGLAKVITLSGVTYNWNTESPGRDLVTKEAGVIAQQIREVLPEAVIEKDDGFLTVKYDRIIPLLIEAIKDLSAEIEILKKRIQ